MNRHLLIPLCAVTLSCSQDDAHFSVEQPSSYWQATCIGFEEKYKACYGPGWSENVERVVDKYDFYEVSVERIMSGGGSSIIHARKYRINEIREGARNRNVQNIVEIDKDSGKILFNIFDKPYEVALE